ncbi:TetR/AcrR family transcriptional regulator [Streptomyces sp. NPDC001513]|uniref:TetR/AcrR family transcriptional regulator n=1 Tax=Streptomyces sp. NPDC001513 TaxID=3364580 RepID=UPI00367A409B
MERENSLRDRLIDVGVELVTTEGTSSLGLREIARRAGVSHGAPRRYFPTHHALLSAIAHRGLADLKDRFTAVTKGIPSARGQLEMLGKTYIGYALECRGMFELLLRHDLLDSQRHASDEPRLRELTLPLFGIIVELVARHREEERETLPLGTTRDMPPPAVSAGLLWSNLHGIAQLWAWGSLPLALGTAGTAGTGGAESDVLDTLVSLAMDTHLGPVKP